MIDINAEYEDLTIEDVVGPLQQKLTAVVEVPQVVLFSGGYGCGKNLGAYLLAQKLGNVEITVRNTVDNTAKGAEGMISQFSAPPLLPSLNQVCVLNEFTLFRKDAQAKFKDIFQAPPVRTYFFICTNEPEKIIPDIYDRFQYIIEVGLLNSRDAYTLTHSICKRYSVDLDKKKKLVVAKGSKGRPRAIINTIKAIKTSGGATEEFLYEMLKKYSSEEGHEQFIILYRILVERRPTNARNLISFIEATGMDATSIQYKILNMCYNNFDERAKHLYALLIPPLAEGREKHDLLVRFMRALKLL